MAFGDVKEMGERNQRWVVSWREIGKDARRRVEGDKRSCSALFDLLETHPKVRDVMTNRIKEPIMIITNEANVPGTGCPGT